MVLVIVVQLVADPPWWVHASAVDPGDHVRRDRRAAGGQGGAACGPNSARRPARPGASDAEGSDRLDDRRACRVRSDDLARRLAVASQDVEGRPDRALSGRRGEQRRGAVAAVARRIRWRPLSPQPGQLRAGDGHGRHLRTLGQGATGLGAHRCIAACRKGAPPTSRWAGRTTRPSRSGAAAK